ncbi:hypothetical protein DCAR_0728105 [Daucus carota subsp. sativus]|uniref:Uncharacterized protein n=1 Tax=Daucus carota subsp. sativus TaxID=79200 RepID=A0A164T847_DAUCS|nr:hypothetical protein DCAR_0728105 [Daucus carota subsp. sativus]
MSTSGVCVGTRAPGSEEQDQREYMDIYSDEEDPVAFGPASVHPNNIIYGGYAFHVDYYAVDNEGMDTPVVMPVYEAEVEDYVLGAGF